MKKAVLAVCTAIGLAMIGTSAIAVKPVNEKTKGNGLPNISMKNAFKFEIHAYTDCPPTDDDNNGKRIIVQAEVGAPHTNTVTENDIMLTQSADGGFDIVDNNACNGVGNGYAEIEVPMDLASTYEVFVALRGDPSKYFDITLCAEESGTNYCSTGQIVTKRSFTNVSKSLLSIPDPGDIFGCPGNRCDLFEASFEGWWWDVIADDHAKASVALLPCPTAKTSNDPASETCFAGQDDPL